MPGSHIFETTDSLISQLLESATKIKQIKNAICQAKNIFSAFL